MADPDEATGRPLLEQPSASQSTTVQRESPMIGDLPTDALADGSAAFPDAVLDIADAHVLDEDTHAAEYSLSWVPTNEPVGLRPWVSIATQPQKWPPWRENILRKEAQSIRCVTCANILYAVFAFPAGVVYGLAGCVMALFGCLTIARKLFMLGAFVIFPFGVALERACPAAARELELGEARPSAPPGPPRPRCLGCQKALFYVLALPPLVVVHCVYFVLSVMAICTLSMARMHAILLKSVARDITSLSLSRTSTAGEVLFMDARAFRARYFKYSYMGVNLMILDSIVVVVAAVAFSFMPQPWIDKNSTLVFLMSLFAIIPLSFLIGESISQLSARTNYGVGAVITATFGSLIEIILYIFALIDGKNVIVLMGISGSILADLLLVPGLSMIIGGIKAKEMRINHRLGSIVGLQLTCATLMLFAPTLFYYMYNEPQMYCRTCSYINAVQGVADVRCRRCHTNVWSDLHTDPAYEHTGKKLMYATSIMLGVTYVGGLVFNFLTHGFYYKARTEVPEDINTLIVDDTRDKIVNRKTRQLISAANHDMAATKARGKHAHGASKEQKAITRDLVKTYKDNIKHNYEAVLQHRTAKANAVAASGHTGRQWHLAMTLIVMIAATTLIALVAEGLIKSLDNAISAMNINREFAGITLFATIPSFSEYINACIFAFHDQLTLSIEIGRATALQVVHIQAPVAVLMGLFINKKNPFTLVYDLFNFVSIFFAVIVHIVIADNRTHNWYKGMILVMTYATIIVMFYYKEPDEAINDVVT